MRIIRPDKLRDLCKEPLCDVQTLYLDRMGIEHLHGLEACPSLTTLHIAKNSLTALEAGCFEGCRELWSIDASNNRLESLPGIASFDVLGHLDLSGNCIPLEALQPLVSIHILELSIAGNPAAEVANRSTILRLLPYLWVLDGEYVTAEERRRAN
ncbi:unnamed protein product, partial [Choristocarpus tenellus]